jgi:hypothetical protein
MAKPVLAPLPAPRGSLLPRGDAGRRRLRRVFLESFVAADVAEPLVSFDAERPAAEVRAFLAAHDFDRAGVRVDGLVRGYVERADLAAGRCADRLRPFTPEDLVPDTASLQDVIVSLGANGRCFVTGLDEVQAVITLPDLEKPPVRMFLFGMVTTLEMLLAASIDAAFPDDGWRALVAPGRLDKAEALQQERRRRGIPARLVDCLQFSDKGQLALEIPGLEAKLVPGVSRKAAKRALKELELLRNNLAHGQEIIPEGWTRIVEFSSRLDRLLESL